ncbi:VOC family protein [Aquibium sp. A9E412]|uniref:VOC family protein n=1 Tax=Aquibium sp. A9E412 TaxID=2976767 RepID=UPI0025B0ED70|nr:VOC family protein [Aquibium sp. A9E412]MDN2567245.1 VOC family protein [Aquibium sp. A9E412]
MADFTPDAAVVWFEIPVSDMARAKRFYAAVLETTLSDQTDGPNPMAVFAVKDPATAPSGHLYPGKPAAAGTGSTVHLAAPAPLEAALERVTQNGGQVVSPIIAIPAGRFAYCLDPDGNSIGLFA